MTSVESWTESANAAGDDDGTSNDSYKQAGTEKRRREGIVHTILF
jgi:hypothetical protein